MPSEAEVVYGYCPQCGAPGVSRERRPNGNDECYNGHLYPSASALKRQPPPQAEVVASSRPSREDFVAWACAQIKLCDDSEYECIGLPETIKVIERRRTMFKECLRLAEPPPAQGKEANSECDCPVVCPKCAPIKAKESPCSNVSQGGGKTCNQSHQKSTGSSSSPQPTPVPLSTDPSPNHPAWATPNILAACGPGAILYWVVHTPDQVRAYPSMRIWSYGKDSGTTLFSEEWCKDQPHESYTIPTPPAAKCRCGGQFGAAFYTCENERFCSTCFHKYFERAKPEPKDGAEEAARKVVYDWNQTDHNAYSEGVLTDNELASLESRITAAIRADREKQAARPATELRGKVKELCEFTIQLTDPDRVTHQLAREVLAELEGT